MDFCKHVLISAINPEMFERVSKQVDPRPMDLHGPVMTPEDLEEILEAGG